METSKAYLITESGKEIEVKPRNGIAFSLEEAQNMVHGYIEVIYLNRAQIMIMNEEGKFYGRANDKASCLAHANHAIMPTDYISGDVVVCPSEMLP